MRNDKKEAISLRKNGYSYSQINELLGIPKSTLSIWLKDVTIGTNAQDLIKLRKSSAIKKLIERNKERTAIAGKAHVQYKSIAFDEAKRLWTDPLFITGCALYWGEGYKKGDYGSKWKSLDFANSDPDMVRIMMLFLNKFFPFAKIRVQVMLHEEKNINDSLRYWSNLTNLPLENFGKPNVSISSASKGIMKKSTPHGTVHLRINDVKSFFRMMGWIDYLKKKF